jgi:NAD(P)-dependent dehydrogenase (short-subunit alcohol dehydrogenase family)
MTQSQDRKHHDRKVAIVTGAGTGIGAAIARRLGGARLSGRARDGKVAATAAMVFSADHGCDVGRDTGAPVSPDYGARGNGSDGRVRGVQIAVAEAAERHTVSPEEALRVAWPGNRAAALSVFDGRSSGHRRRFQYVGLRRWNATASTWTCSSTTR